VRIGIDIDDTICYSIENILPYICEYYKLDYELEKEKTLSYDAYHSLPNYYEFSRKYYDLIMPNAKLKERADYYINKLYERGHEIIFITARNYLGFTDPYKLSSEYLEKYNIHYNKLIVGVAEKGKICKEEDIDIFIDDNLKNCSNVEKENIKVWLFDNGFNRHDNHFDRVYNWEEVYNKIVSKEKNQLIS